MGPTAKELLELTLKQCLSRIPFNSSINPLMLEHLRYEMEKTNNLDKNCVILFDEMKLASGLHYEAHKQVITGYADLGHLGRSSKLANHALVFMVRISTAHLKEPIKQNIEQLQAIGLTVLATVCDQGVTNQAALEKLCEGTRENALAASFTVNKQTVCVINDVPHLLKNTRKCLLKEKLKFKPSKEAKLEYIEKAFNLDKEKRHESKHFCKMCITYYLPILGSSSCPTKMYQCPLSYTSVHLEFWNQMLKEIADWRIFDLNSNKDITNLYSFAKGWQITLRSTIYIWNNLKNQGMKYLSLKSFNQDQLENLFGVIRQHEICNTNPSCHQFVAALKTAVVNSMATSVSSGNCEN
ncbi:hypothetical protein ILUMI_06641 [Ignelater luminosus]|uniref:Transposable element P transposase n=1 Tax=Ignelater luminosus TaxID=2038154 RepID=A0A8K0DAA1_IGNLU|nr:hypothetical protein ILUMI_06641 [Ignelater luminosus]